MYFPLYLSTSMGFLLIENISFYLPVNMNYIYMLLYRLQYYYILYKTRIILNKYIIMFTRHDANINVIARKLTKRNTRRVYDCKHIEFFEFFIIFSVMEKIVKIINEKKVFRFNVYQCYCPKKGKGDK